MSSVKSKFAIHNSSTTDYDPNQMIAWSSAQFNQLGVDVLNAQTKQTLPNLQDRSLSFYSQMQSENKSVQLEESAQPKKVDQYRFQTNYRQNLHTQKKKKKNIKYNSNERLGEETSSLTESQGNFSHKYTKTNQEISFETTRKVDSLLITENNFKQKTLTQVDFTIQAYLKSSQSVAVNHNPFKQKKVRLIQPSVDLKEKANKQPFTLKSGQLQTILKQFSSQSQDIKIIDRLSQQTSSTGNLNLKALHIQKLAAVNVKERCQEKQKQILQFKNFWPDVRRFSQNLKNLNIDLNSTPDKSQILNFETKDIDIQISSHPSLCNTDTDIQNLIAGAKSLPQITIKRQKARTRVNHQRNQTLFQDDSSITSEINDTVLDRSIKFDMNIIQTTNRENNYETTIQRKQKGQNSINDRSQSLNIVDVPGAVFGSSRFDSSRLKTLNQVMSHQSSNSSFEGSNSIFQVLRAEQPNDQNSQRSIEMSQQTVNKSNFQDLNLHRIPQEQVYQQFYQSLAETTNPYNRLIVICRPSGDPKIEKQPNIVNVVKNGVSFEMTKVKKILHNSIRMDGQNIPAIIKNLSKNAIGSSNSQSKINRLPQISSELLKTQLDTIKRRPPRLLQHSSEIDLYSECESAKTTEKLIESKMPGFNTSQVGFECERNTKYGKWLAGVDIKTGKRQNENIQRKQIPLKKPLRVARDTNSKRLIYYGEQIGKTTSFGLSQQHDILSQYKVSDGINKTKSNQHHFQQLHPSKLSPTQRKRNRIIRGKAGVGLSEYVAKSNGVILY